MVQEQGGVVHETHCEAEEVDSVVQEASSEAKEIERVMQELGLEGCWVVQEICSEAQ